MYTANKCTIIEYEKTLLYWVLYMTFVLPGPRFQDWRILIMVAVFRKSINKYDSGTEIFFISIKSDSQQSDDIQCKSIKNGAYFHFLCV